MSGEHAKEFLLRNRMPELDALAEGLAEFCLRHGLDEEACADVRLVAEEAVSNIIRHGYADRASHEICVRVSVEGEELSLEIEDDARPFNPLEAPMPDLTLPAEEKPIGGLGITLLRTLMDRSEYRRDSGRNRLRFVRLLKRP